VSKLRRFSLSARVGDGDGVERLEGLRIDHDPLAVAAPYHKILLAGTSIRATLCVNHLA